MYAGLHPSPRQVSPVCTVAATQLPRRLADQGAACCGVAADGTLRLSGLQVSRARRELCDMNGRPCNLPRRPDVDCRSSREATRQVMHADPPVIRVAL